MPVKTQNNEPWLCDQRTDDFAGAVSTLLHHSWTVERGD